MSRPLHSSLIAFLLVIAGGVTSDAQTESGHLWYGMLVAAGAQIPLLLHVSGSGTSLSATADSPGQAAFGASVDSISESSIDDGQTLRFTISSVKATYNGTGKGDTMSGVFVQNASTTPLVLKRFTGYDANAANAAAADWAGVLKTPTGTLHLVLHVNFKSGALSATLDSPDQNVYGGVIDTIAVDKNELLFEMTPLHIFYVGSINGNAMSGMFTQGGISVPMTFAR